MQIICYFNRLIDLVIIQMFAQPVYFSINDKLLLYLKLDFF